MSHLNEEEKAKDSYWFWLQYLNNNFIYQNNDQQIKLMAYQNYETYKELKVIAKQTNPEVSKEEIYDQLLKPFRHEKVKHWNCI